MNYVILHQRNGGETLVNLDNVLYISGLPNKMCRLTVSENDYVDVIESFDDVMTRIGQRQRREK